MKALRVATFVAATFAPRLWATKHSRRARRISGMEANSDCSSASSSPLRDPISRIELSISRKTRPPGALHHGHQAKPRGSWSGSLRLVNGQGARGSKLDARGASHLLSPLPARQIQFGGASAATTRGCGDGVGQPAPSPRDRALLCLLRSPVMRWPTWWKRPSFLMSMWMSSPGCWRW